MVKKDIYKRTVQVYTILWQTLVWYKCDLSKKLKTQGEAEDALWQTGTDSSYPTYDD